MKIICQKSSLLKSVNISLKAVPSKTTMPILECILIDATTSQIKFTSNDMELGIETIVEGRIEEKGMIALDAKIFYEIIRRLPDNDITIRTDDKFVATITCEKAKFNIPGKSGEDFAYLPVIEREESLSISQYTLKEMIRQTIFSIAMNENNRLMTGELFEIKDNCLKIVSLDGHRISIRKMPLKGEYTNRKLVVPGKTLSEISKILSGEVDDQVSIFFTKNHILFEFDRQLSYPA
jgi:DNA polymerase-3 subunit beta